MNGPGFFVLSVDNLPAELPREASDHFSDALVSHVRDLAAGTKTAQLGRVLRDAVIADEGHLYGPHVKLEETVKNNKCAAALFNDTSFLTLLLAQWPRCDWLGRA